MVASMVEEARRLGCSRSRFRVRPDIGLRYSPTPSFRIQEWPPGTRLAPNVEGLAFGPWFERYLGRPLPDSPEWTTGAIFAVRNDHILARPLAFYQNLLASVSYHRDPETAHFLERAWLYVVHFF